MTGFGWDPSHSIVKARQEGLQTVLYKPFRVDRLMDAVEQALRTVPAVRPSSTAQHDGTPQSGSSSPPSTPVAQSPAAVAQSPPAAAQPDNVIDRKPADSQPIEASNHES